MESRHPIFCNVPISRYVSRTSSQYPNPGDSSLQQCLCVLQPTRIQMAVRLSIYSTTRNPHIINQSSGGHNSWREGNFITPIMREPSGRMFGENSNSPPRASSTPLFVWHRMTPNQAWERGSSKSKARIKSSNIFSGQMCLWEGPNVPMSHVCRNVRRLVSQPGWIGYPQNKRIRAWILGFPNPRNTAKCQKQNHKSGTKCTSWRCGAHSP